MINHIGKAMRASTAVAAAVGEGTMPTATTIVTVADNFQWSNDLATKT